MYVCMYRVAKRNCNQIQIDKISLNKNYKSRALKWILLSVEFYSLLLGYKTGSYVFVCQHSTYKTTTTSNDGNTYCKTS